MVVCKVRLVANTIAKPDRRKLFNLKNIIGMKKLSIKLLATAAIMFTATVATMAQGSFAYQAVIRDNGELVSEKKVGLKFTLKQGGQEYYSETQQVTTNKYGNISVMVGSGTKVSGDFMKVPWSSMNVMLGIQVDPKGGTSYTDMGEIQLQAAPYAMYAMQTSRVVATGAANNDAIFEVKDNKGEVVFAVFPDGVKVYVDDSDASKAARSGFIVTGRTATKGATSDYFTVTADGTQIYVDDDPAKAARSGFIVTGRTATKGGNDNYLAVNAEGTQVYVDDDPAKAARSGFIVTGRTATKGGTDNYLAVNADGTQVYVDTDPTSGKAARSGFIVTGRTATKGSSDDDLLAVNADGTQVYVDLTNDKAARSGFIVTGRTATKGGYEYDDVLKINGDGTQVIIDDDPAKAARSGFIVTGRTATKEGEATKYVDVNGESIEFSSSSFNVSDKKTSEKVLAVTNGNVHVNSDLLMGGELNQKFDDDVMVLGELEPLEIEVGAGDTEESIQDPISTLIVNGATNPYSVSLLGIIGEDTYVKPIYDNGESLFFNKEGKNISNVENAAVKVYNEQSSIRIEVIGSLIPTSGLSFKFAFGSYDVDGDYKVVIVNATVEKTE